MSSTAQSRAVATILSTNFAGSHFLSLMLGSHSACMHLGEIRHRRRKHDSNDRKECWLCAEPEQCPLLRGIGIGDIGNVYETIFCNMANPGLRVLIDASKKINWARRHMHDDRFRMKYIHLIRDPRALVRRWCVSYETQHQKDRERWRGFLRLPELAWQWACGQEHEVFTYKWLYQNREISRFLTRHRLDALTVTYHDLAKYPQREVERICNWLGLEFEPAQIEYWNFPHHGTQKPEYQWINEQQTRHFDTRWREFLAPEILAWIERNQRVRRYLAELHLEMTDDGLVRQD